MLILGIEEDELRKLIENGPPPFLVKEYSRLEKLADITRAKCDELRKIYGFPPFRPGYYEICEEHRFGRPTTKEGQRNLGVYARCKACKWIQEERGKSDGDSLWEVNKPSAAARGLARVALRRGGDEALVRSCTGRRRGFLVDAFSRISSEGRLSHVFRTILSTMEN